MGLLDFMNTDEARMGLGLLAAAGPRSDGAGFGQRLQEGIGYADQYKQGQQKSKYVQMQMDEAQAKIEQEKVERERLQTIRQGMGGFFKPGQQALAPLMGNAETGILASAGRDAVAPSFDTAGAAQFLAQNGEYEKAFAMMPKPKELAVNKLDVKDFTPASVQKFAQTGSYADLVRMDKLHMGTEGGDFKGRNPFTGEEVVSSKISKSFSDVTSERNNQLGWANHALSRERMTFDKAGGAEGGKPQLVDGQWVYKPDARNPQGRVVPVLGMADKPFTDSQGKANLFGTRMIEAEKALQSVAGTADRPGWLKRTAQTTVGLVPFAGDKLSEVAGSALNFTQSPAQQQVEQAKEDFINALMRRESGAVIGRDEFSNADRQYFPQVGDSDAKIAQKERNRKTAINGIMAEVPRSRSGATGGATGDFGGVKFLGFE